MNEVKIFSFESNEIRSLMINNEPWFVGKDVAEVLGYTNPQKAIRDHVDVEDKGVNESFTVNGTQGILINESGLYSLILSSKLPKAKKFKRWVTSEVLPEIRRTGSYNGLSNQDKFELAGLISKCKNTKAVEALMMLFEVDKPVKQKPSTRSKNGVQEYLKDIEEWELISFTSKEVHNDYVSFCHDNKIVPLALAEFSKEIHKQTGAIVKRHRVDGQLTGFYVLP